MFSQIKQIRPAAERRMRASVVPTGAWIDMAEPDGSSG